MIYRVFTLVSLFCLVLSLALVPNAQTPTPASSVDEKSQQVINRAIETLGGASYLNVQTVVGKGFFTTYNEGVSQIPARFIDYLAYPDRERTEFTGAGIRTIQTRNAYELGKPFTRMVEEGRWQGGLCRTP